MIARNSPDNHDGLPSVLVLHLKQQVGAMERIMRWFYGVCALWFMASIGLVIYSRPVAEFIVDHWQ